MEDVELGMRLHGRGARIVLDPELRGTHLKRWTLPEMVRTDLARRGVPWVRILLRRRELSTALNLSPRHRLTAALHLLAALRPRLALPSLAAVVALNHGFYALLLRRGGPRLALAGVALHLVHSLTAAASVPAGIVAHLRAGDEAPAPRAAERVREVVG
jgi:hypothetical protein